MAIKTDFSLLCAGMSAIFSLRLLFELGDEHRADSSGQCLPRFRRLYMVACLFGGVLAWIKNEGMMVGLILVLGNHSAVSCVNRAPPSAESGASHHTRSSDIFRHRPFLAGYGS